MGRYGGWGAADAVFAPGASGNDLRDRERLRAVLTRLGGSGEAGERLFRSAGLTVLNAHYTDPMLVGAIYQALAKLGLVQGTVVEPGAGSGQFAAFAPAGIRITGVELDTATALIAQLLHPDAEILTGSVSDPRFARVRDQSAAPVRVPRDTADGFVGNVPFGDVKWPDEVLNPGTRFSLHDHAIRWGVTRVAPGGLCAFITSRYTADAVNPRFRRTLAGELELIGMVRLPSAAHKRMAGTDVVTDIIIGRRIADGERPLTSPESWEQSRPLAIPGSSQAARVNSYFHDNPRHILGALQAGGMYRAGDFTIAPSGDLEQQLSAALGEITGRALALGQRSQPRPAARPVIEILSRRPDGTITAKRDGTFTQVVHGQDVPLVISSEREAGQTRKLVALAEARSTLIRAEASCPEDTDEIDAMRSRMGELYDAYTAAYGPIGRFTTRTVTYHVKTLEGVLDRLDFSRKDVPDPEVKLLEAYLGRDALTRIVRSAADPGQVRHSTRKDKQGETVAVATQLVETAKVRAALMTALAQIPQGADAEAITATFSERMSGIETGEQRTRLMPAAFRSDPRRPAVEALETFDPVTQTATRKPVFSRRTAMPHRMELGADTPQEALDLALIHRRRVDLGEIARLLGTGEADARAQLGTLVFDDPAAGNLVAAGEYLSANVREKLAAARTAAAGDPERYTANVESLQAVQPPALAAEDIQARLGSAWLSREIVQEGLRYVLDDPRLTVIHPGGSEWKVESRTARNSRAQDTYGTSDWNALDLAGALLTNASITVRRTTIDPVTGAERSYRDDAATLFAFRKAQRLDADFVSWLWSDPERADECVRLYNSAYNNQVKRVWDASPFYIPGLAPGMKLHPFQNAMVRRLHTESGLAAWVVGAGKTELGIVAAMEGARLGRHRLTAIVTPASLVNQWRDRIYRTYPEARVLVADDDLRGRKDSRAVFTERAASGDYQLAITPYEFFGSLPLSADAARASVDEEIDKLTRYAQEAIAQGDRYTAKDLQGKIAKLEAKYSAAVKASGGAAGFTDAGIDSVVVDEWHNFRRIRRESNNRLLAMEGSGRANHMLAVFDYLRKQHPEGLLLGLSGTPLEQSIADAWAAMRFFTPERLKALGLEEFDAFLTTFGRTEPRREPTPTGSGLHVRERQADWFNLPDMRRTLWEPFADVVRRADLGLSLPRLAGGRPQTHVLPQTPGQARMQADIDHRYELFKAGDREGDNHILKLMDQAGKNALHPRMLGMDTDGKIKLEVWADDAAAWYHANRDAGFLDRDGNPHPVPGALRMVACELGVPDAARPNAWSVYSEMRSLLAARGVPAGAIRFAQDADSDRKKAALWEDARTGRCNFVIGSAQTAGTGVDVPDRLQVLDYMTLSWNPTQFEQWLGRIVRQGNQNPEVAANVWATEGTIEVLRADKIAMKSAPFEALLDGTSETRRLTEEDDNPISAWAAEMTARMSGNPLLTAQREAQLEVDVAQGMQNEWQRENGVKARRLAVMDKEIQELEAENAAIDGALGRAVDTKGDKFAARVGTGQYTVRAEAGAALIAALTATAAGDVSTLTGGNPQHLAELAGFPVTARYNRVTLIMPAHDADGQETGQDAEPTERTLITLGLEGVPQGQVGVIDAADLPGRDPAALITSLEDRIRRLPGHKAKNTAAIAGNRDQITKTRAELAQPSPYLQQLAGARDALDRIEAQISEQIKDDTPAPDAAVSGADGRADGSGTDVTTDPPAASGPADLGQEPAGTGTSLPPGPETGQQPPGLAEPAPVPAGDPGPDGSTGAAASATALAAGDVASLPPWTAGSPHSAAITATYQAALADSNLTQAARGNHLDRFLHVITDWVSNYAADTTADDSQVPPLALTVFDDPVFAADLACAVGAAVHASCTGQAPPPPGSQIPPEVTLAALSHWQEEDEATARVAATDQWRDIETAAQIDIWLSRAGLPRQGRQVRWHPGGHAVLELTAADGEQWRLHVPRPQDARHEATARYNLTRSGQDGWSCLLNGTPGSTTPQQAATLLTGTLKEENVLLPAPAAASARGQAAPAAVQAGHAASAAPATPVADEAADGQHPRSPDGAEKPGDGQAPPGSGLTREDLDFAYQHAGEYARGGSRDPGPEQEERALDYAAWYLAAYRDEESMADLPDHRYAWARFADQGYPAREPARTASGQRDQDRPGTGATAEAAGPAGHAGQEPPAAGSTAGLRQLAAAHGLAAETVKTGGTLMTTVHDDVRTVLLHDDISGTRAGGQRLDPGEVPAYLAAYARHPHLPPRCLADLARHDPGEPAPLTVTAARETAARHGLEVRIRRVSGQSYITFCEPGTNGTPVLSYPAGAASAHHGPCAVPVTVIGRYLAAYRESVPAATFTVPEPRDWGRRVAPLTPHLVDGSSHFSPAARDRLRAGLAAARGDDIAEARRLLGEAEELTPVTLAPEREAELTAAIRRHTARYGHTEDPAAYLATASPPVLDASERELGWVRTYIAGHPEVREHPEAGEPAAGPGSDREAAVRIGQQAKEALESGDHQRALALIDEAELRYPDPAIHWDGARDQVRAAISNRAPGNPQDRQRPQAPAAETPAAGTPPAAPQPGPAASAPPAASSQPQTVPEAATADETGTNPGHEEPAGNGPAEPDASPLTNSDLAAELRRLPGFARWLSQAGAPPAAGDLDSQRPGAGSSAVCDERGIEITVSGPGFTRQGLVTWPQAASWIDKGVTPARLGLVIIAGRLSTFCRTHRDQLIAASTCDPDATAAELGQIRDTAVAMIVDAALRSRGAAVPVPPPRPDDPAWYTAVMITRPDRAAGKAENAALERLTRLRTLIREPQPATAAEIRATLRRRIGHGLADAVRAPDDPAAMRAWISSQASRPVPGSYDNSGERWYGTSPDGLITDRNDDDRAPSCIRWEEIPAWIQPGITSSLRDRLLAAADASSAIFRRTASAAARQDPGAAPGEEEDKQARQRLREAADAAWAAIEAAPPPSPADLDRARHDYRDWRPVQQTLFDDPSQDSTPTPDDTRATTSPQPRPAPSAPPAPAGRPAGKAAAPLAEPALQHNPPGHPAAGTRPGPAPGPAEPARARSQPGGPDGSPAPAGDQAAPPVAPAPVPAPSGGLTFGSQARGYAARMAELRADTGSDPGVSARRHPWGLAITHPDGPSPDCQPTVLTADLRCGHDPGRDEACQCTGNDLLYRGACRGCDWEGEPRTRENQATEDAHDHAFPGWRDLPAVESPPYESKAGQKRWIREVGRLYPPGWLERGGPVRTLRGHSGDRHHQMTMAGLPGYDIAAPRDATPGRTTPADSAAVQAALPEQPVRAPEPDGGGMRFMNTMDIEEAVDRWRDHPVLGPASCTLANVEAWADANSDGWANWPLPARAAGRLMILIERDGTYLHKADTVRADATPAALRAAYTPLKAFRTRHNAEFTIEEPATPREARRKTPPKEAADTAGPEQLSAVGTTPAAAEAETPPAPGESAGLEPKPDSAPGAATRPARPAQPISSAQVNAGSTRTPPAGTLTGLPARQDATGEAPASAGNHHGTVPATVTPAASPSAPLVAEDIFLGISRLPAFVIGDLFHAIDTDQPLESVGRQLAPYSGERAAGEADPGAREAVTAEPAGLRIQVDPAGSSRTGLITWPQIDDLLRPGLTPARRQIVVQATQIRLRFAAANASFRAVGESSLAAAAEDELRAQAGAAVAAILGAARSSGAGQPPQPAEEAATAGRIAILGAALPSQPPQPRAPAGQIQAGDIIGHPGYRFQPFRVSAPPRHTDAAVEITGCLTDPSDGEPAGQITLALPRTGHLDPVVYLIPAPARSLRPLFGGTTPADEDTGPDRTHDEGTSPGRTAQPAYASPGQPAATAQRPHSSPPGTPGTGSTAAAASTPAAAAPSAGRGGGTSQPPGAAPPIQEDIMPPALPVTPPSAEGPAPAAGPAPAGGEPAARPGASSQAPPDGHAADRLAGDARLLHELDHVLAAILERRHAAAAPAGADGTAFADIRAAFAVLRSVLDLPGPASNGSGVRPAAPPGNRAAPAAAPAQDGTAAADGDFGDIRAAFASLRDVLGLPAPGSDARPAALGPDTPAGPDTATARLLDQAAAEAHACARWYRDTPEWQRMTRIGRAARDLLTTIREAAGDYWAEIRLDIRARGFARTLAARVSLAVSGAAHLLAGRLERGGHRDSRPWRAAWRLHQATATFASKVMNYTPPGSRTRMDDARRIIDDLGRSPRRPGEPGPSPAAGSPGTEPRRPGAAALGRESFPVLVSRANARQAAAPATRSAAPPRPRQAQPTARP